MNPADILARQRNDALVEAADARLRHEIAARAAEAAFRALHECILSGQVPDERVPGLVASVPGFAEWRDAQRDPARHGAGAV